MTTTAPVVIETVFPEPKPIKIPKEWEVERERVLVPVAPRRANG